MIEHVMIEGVKFVPETKMGYVIVRSHSAGCFAGYLKSRDGRNVTLTESRRLWYWSGAASLSQLAIDGTSKPKDCKFPEALPLHEILEVCEILQVSDKAKNSIKDVPVWRA